MVEWSRLQYLASSLKVAPENWEKIEPGVDK